MNTIRQYATAAILAVIGLALIAAACVAIWYLRVIFLYIIIAAILTILTRPLENLLEKVKIRKRKLPRSIRALTVLLGIYLVIFIFIAVFIPLFMNEGKILANVDTNKLTSALHEPISKLDTLFSNFQHGEDKQTLTQYVQQVSGKMLDAAQISSVANSITGFIRSICVAFLVISFFTFFFIKDGPAIFETLLLLVPSKHVNRARNIVDDTSRMLTKYFTGVLIDVLFVATFISIAMAIIGVKNAIIIGFFAGVMNIIPYIGPVIGALFAIVIGLSTNLDLDFYTGMLPLVEKISIVFIICAFVDAFLIQPMIFSKRVKAHPIEIFTVTLIAGTLANIGGMIVAVPLYTIIRIIAREFLSKYRFVQRLTDELEETNYKNDDN